MHGMFPRRGPRRHKEKKLAGGRVVESCMSCFPGGGPPCPCEERVGRRVK